MKRSITLLLALILIGIANFQVDAQSASTSDGLVAQPIADRIVPFDVADPGVSKTIKFGADLAWANEQNFRRVILFTGLDQLDLIRASFQPTYPLVNGTDLTQEQLDDLNWRLYLIDTYAGPNTDLALNCDHPWVDQWYAGQPARWEQLIETTAQAFLNAGHNVVTVGAFNEPDYGWGQGSFQDMYDITALLNSNPFFNNIRLSGGNTLSCDAALGWYQDLIPAGVDEGNTHQLAGSFDSFAHFLQTVRANGHHATLDEMHNVVEGLVGYEYGMQTGIWWGPAELARGEMVKAFDGQRLGYAEHRPNWTAAAVYRAPDGKIQAFGGTSERQAVTTTFNFISKDRVVYYDGYGPQREFVLEMPGGTGYQQGQTNAERVINISWGDDIQPVVNGQYIVVNKSTGLVMEVQGNASQDGSNVAEGSYSGGAHQQWHIYPVDSRVGGDFSYYKIQPLSNNTKFLDLNNYSLDNGGNLHQWSEGPYGNQQYYMDYAGDNYFYIRSRESSKCLQVSATGNVEQWEKTGTASQQWRVIPVGAPIEFTPPSVPGSLVATAQTASIKLEWTASPESDVAGYTILRAESAAGPYNTIARDVTATSFVDNSALVGITYHYAVRAEDNSLNRSANSNGVSAMVTGSDDLVTHYEFDNNVADGTVHLNHAATHGGVSYTAGVTGNAISLNSSDAFVQLPPDIANHAEITVSAWINWSGGGAWQRIFDFGNGTDQYMFLSPSSGGGQLHFGIKNGGGEQVLTASALPASVWTHVAVTLGANGAVMYVNGQQVASSGAITINPLDFKPVLNYIGRSQWPDPLFSGLIDDFRVYNYELSAFEIAQLGSGVVTFYQLRNRGTGLYLDGMGRTVNGDACGQYANTAHINSHWEFVDTGDGYVQIKNRGTGMFLDGMGRTINGEACGQWDNTSSTNSHWSVQQYDGIYYRIQNRVTDMFVDGYGFTSNGSDVNQYANTGHVNAQWELVNVAGARIVGEHDYGDREEKENVNELALYPNPAHDFLNVRLENQGEDQSITISDLSGMTIVKERLSGVQNTLNIANLKGGIYFVRILNGNEVVSFRKLIKN